MTAVEAGPDQAVDSVLERIGHAVVTAAPFGGYSHSLLKGKNGQLRGNTLSAVQGRVWLSDVPSPGVHDLAALLQQVRAPVGRLDGVLDDMREARLGQLTADGRLGAPVAER